MGSVTGAAATCRKDGTRKVRPVDHFSWAGGGAKQSRKRRRLDSVNGRTAVPEAIRHDHLDDLAGAMAELRRCVGCGRYMRGFTWAHVWLARNVEVQPALWKLDIDSAFRRVPIAPEHRWAAGVAFMHDDAPHVSFHNACAFGATSSVHSWERVGAMLTVFARKLLRIPVFRYVDDLFSTDRPVCVLARLLHARPNCVGGVLGRPCCVEHAMHCMERLVKAVLGEDAVAIGKLEFGTAQLVVLGIVMAPRMDGFTCRLSPKTAEKCSMTIREAIASGTLQPGCAKKLAGRLSWATQFLFKRLGRAMLAPLFGHAYGRHVRDTSRVCVSVRWGVSARRCSAVEKELLVALEWWLYVLSLDIVERHAWNEPESAPAHLWVDARGVPPRSACVGTGVRSHQASCCLAGALRCSA